MFTCHASGGGLLLTRTAAGENKKGSLPLLDD
jgi:hypothetical protein